VIIFGVAITLSGLLLFVNYYFLIILFTKL